MRLPSRLTSTIWGPPPSRWSGAAGWGWRRTIPPRRTEPVSRGWKMSATSYCLSSPVPQQDTYSQRSSTDRSMSETSGGTAPEGLEGRGELVGVGRLGRDGDDLGGRPLVAVAVPEEDRPRQVLDAGDHAHEPPGLGRVVGRADLEHQLVGVAQVDPLGEGALRHALEVEVVAEPPPEQVLGVQAVLDHRGRAPLGGDHGVVLQVPPAVVAEGLVAPVQLPGADDLEAVVVEQGHPAGAVVAVGPAQVEQEDAAGSAVDGVGTGVAGLGGQLLGGDLTNHL